MKRGRHDRQGSCWAPWHWLALLTGAKDFTANPVIGSPHLNGRGLYTWRKKLAQAVCDVRRRWWLGRQVPAAWREAYAADGYVRLDGFLPPGELQAVRREAACAALPVLWMAQPPALTRRINLDRASCAGAYPALARLLGNRPLLRLLRYAAGYGGQPIIALQCIRADAPGEDSGHDPQADWHVDTFHSAGKAWLFLHDVAAEHGPFAYFAGSHRANAARDAWDRAQSTAAATHPNRMHARGSLRAGESDLRAMYPGREPFVAAVPANTLIVADVGGFHRRTPSGAASVRVEVYLSLRRNPFFAGLYPSLLGLPLVRSRWAAWVLAWYQARLRRGRPGWIPAEQPGLDAQEAALLDGRQPAEV